MRLAVAVLLVLTLPATAGPDALGCFRRIYDRAHLARHPDQVVTGVQLHIYRPPPEIQVEYWFHVQFRLRGKDETLSTGGACFEMASGLRCVVGSGGALRGSAWFDPDGGGVNVVPRARVAMMYLDRIRFLTPC